MAAGMINYLSALTQKFREKLYNKWVKDIEEIGIPITPNLNFNALFSDPILIKKWIDNGLPNDSYSIQNAIILNQTSMQSILIDPQHQANNWLRKELKDVKILNMRASRFMYELKFALKFGSTIIIENVLDKNPRNDFDLHLQKFQCQQCVL